MKNMDQFYFKTNHHITKIIKTIRRLYYGENGTNAMKTIINSRKNTQR